MSYNKEKINYNQLVEAYPGIEQGDISSLGRFAYDQTQGTDGTEPIDEWEDGFQEWYIPVNNAFYLGRDYRDDFRYMDTPRVVAVQEFKKDLYAQQEFEEVKVAISDMDPVRAAEFVTDFVIRKGFGSIETTLPGPMTPEGGKLFTPIKIDPETGKISDYDIEGLETPDGRNLDGDLVHIIGKKLHSFERQQAIDTALESIPPITQEEITPLRMKYGAKAASLHLFSQRINQLNQILKNGKVHVAEISIPPHKSVSVELYRAWLSDDPQYEDMIETVRQHALEIMNQETSFRVSTTRLIAVRSSAVNSEDGVDSSGAGIYESTVVDPNDPLDFRGAIEKVFDSTESEKAKSYRESIGVDDEEMGILLQAYTEITRGSRDNIFWGHINTAGAHPNILDLNTQKGQLLYDRKVVQKMMLHDGHNVGYGNDLLHTNPDKDLPVHDAIRELYSVPYAALIAEQLFGMPMQLEFVNNQIVQVRPIVDNIEVNEAVQFLDRPHIAQLKGVGVFDGTLDILSEHQDNRDDEGIVVFWEEDKYSIRGSMASFSGSDFMGMRAYPKDGAVLILFPSTHGHIQTICREKGIPCIFPANHDKEARSIMDFLRDEETKGVKIRVISDGYEARIYTAEEEPENIT